MHQPTRLALALSGAFAIGSLPAQAQTQTRTAVDSLDTIVVSAAGFEQDIKQAPASISVITHEELASKDFSSIAEAIGDIEGVDIGDSAGKTGGLNISIRGMPADYTLIMIDGRRQNVAGNVTPNGFGETSTSFIPPLSAIERIEVIRGPMSTLYGSDAMGGVVNIITKKVSPEWGGSLTLGSTLQTDNRFGHNQDANVYVSGPIKQDVLGVALRGSIFHRGASDISYPVATGADAVPVMGANPVKYTNTSVGAKFSLTPNADHDIVLDIDSQRQKYDNSDSARYVGTVDNPALGTYGGYTDTQRFNRHQYSLSHTGRLGFGTIESVLSRNETETLGRTIPRGVPGKAPGSDRTLEIKTTILDSKLILPIDTSWGEHLLTVGGQWQDGKMTDAVATNDFKYEQWALFVENEYRPIHDLALTAGVRYDHHDAFGGHTSPRGYIVWTSTPNWTFKGGVSAGYKTPRLDQLADGIIGFGGQGRFPLIGTPTLKPEKSLSTEVGVLYDSLDGFTSTLTLFNNDFKDKIASGPGVPNCSFAGDPNRPGCVDFGYFPSQDTYGQSVNVDKAVTRGVEFSTRWQLDDAWAVSGNYTYTSSKQKSGANEGAPLTNTPRHMFNAKLDWVPNDTWSAWMRTEIRSSRYRSDDAIRDQLGNYKSYALFHVGGAYRVNKDVTLNAGIYNLFDKDFIDYQPYRTASGGTGYSNRYINNQEGRRFWLSATIQF